MNRLLKIAPLLLLLSCNPTPAEVEPKPQIEEEKNCYSLDVSRMNFDDYAIYDLKERSGRLIAVITREYLGSGLDRQAVLIYPVDADAKPRTDSIFVDRITKFYSGSDYVIPEESIHGGTLRYYMAENAFYYNNIAEACHEPADKIYIKVRDDGSTFCKTESNTTAQAQYTPQTLRLDGYNYPLVKIGNTVWTAQNLRASHYADGSAIPTGSWSQHSATFGASKNPATGMLYNAYAAGHSTDDNEADREIVSPLAPTGWRLPSARTGGDWYNLSVFAVGSSALRTTGTNITGFSIVPFGRCTAAGALVDPADDDHLFWTSTNSSAAKAYIAKIFFKTEGDNIQYFSATDKRAGFGVRLVKDF